jgi:hypothetical protein
MTQYYGPRGNIALRGLCAGVHSPNPARCAVASAYTPDLDNPSESSIFIIMNTAAGKNNLRKSTMAGTVRARAKRGMLELLEKIDLPEGKGVSVTVLETPTAREGDGLRRSAGAWKGLVDADKLIENIYADRLISTRPVPRL